MLFHNHIRKRCLAIVTLLPVVLCFTSKRIIALRNVQNSRHRRVDRTRFVAPITSLSHLAESDGNLTDESNLYSRYMDLLDRRPFVTQSISAGIISALGDVLSQWIELKHISLSLNWVRLIAFWVCGTLYVGPFIHLWYSQLWKMGRWMERKYQTSKRLQTLSQVIVDQTVGVAFFFPTYFYSYEYIEALITWRAPDLAATHTKCLTELASVFVMQYRVWPITNWVIFAYIPENLRVLASNIVGVFWNAYLCTRVA